MSRHFLNRNELEIAPPAKVLRALRTFSADHLNHYLEEHHASLLVPELSRRFHVSAKQIGVYYGLEDFLRMVFGGLRPKRDVVLMNELHYAYYDEIAKLKGVWIKNFKLNRGTEAFSFDVDDCIRQVKILKPAVLILTSPNNPTGHTISPAEFLSILRVVPKSTLVLLDEAYIGFQRNYQPGAYLRMLKRFPNLGLMRTFSKDYGLAGIRLAYVLGGRNVMSMLKEEPRDLGLARVQEEVGLAALESETERRQHVKEIIQLRDAFIKSVNATKSFLAYASEANFVLLRARTAVALKRLMVEQARMQTTIVKMYGSRYVRVSIGRRGEQAQLLRMMKRIDGQV